MSEIPDDTVAAIEATLDDVDRSLERLRDGTYRRCERCGGEIDESILLDDPVRTTCATHPTLTR